MIGSLLSNYSITKNDFFLKYLKEDLSDFGSEELSSFLKDGYQSGDPYITKMATLFNSIYTHKMQCFFLTSRTFYKLLVNDPNNKYNSLSGLEYKILIKLMVDKTGHFECLRKPYHGRAGVFKLVQPQLVNTLYKLHDQELEDLKGTNWFAEREKDILKIYDSESKSKTVAEKSPADLRREMDRQIAEWKKQGGSDVG